MYVCHFFISLETAIQKVVPKGKSVNEKFYKMKFLRKLKQYQYRAKKNKQMNLKQNITYILEKIICFILKKKLNRMLKPQFASVPYVTLNYLNKSYFREKYIPPACLYNFFRKFYQSSYFCH